VPQAAREDRVGDEGFVLFVREPADLNASTESSHSA
jgi:hypothetical protein